MVNKSRKIVWDLTARTSFKQIIFHIKKDSLQNAEKVKNEILASIACLKNEPEVKHAADKYKQFNDGSFRAFELHRIRVSYCISGDLIIIVRIRHTSMRPESY